MSRRLAYMHQLGIDVYVPRVVLPRARASALSLRPTVAPRPAAVVPAPAPVDRAAPGVRQGPRIELPEERQRSQRRPLEQPAGNPAAASAVRFQLLLVAFAENVLFVSDLKTAPLNPGLEASVMQFLRELMFALGRGAAEASPPAYFQWPLVSRPGVDNGAQRAREVLAGFLQRQLQECRPQHLVLLGEQASAFVQPEGERLGSTAVQLWRSVPLGKLFGDPQSKAQLWRTLQALNVRG